MVYIWAKLLWNLIGQTHKNHWSEIKNKMINQVWLDCK
jgi:hypothetical protein